MTKIRKFWISREELLDTIASSRPPLTTIDAGNVGGLTAGSIPFAGTTGFLTQNNANLFWDATEKNLGIGTNVFGATMTQGIQIATGLAPTANVVDTFAFYSADFAVGNACPHFRTENGTVIGLNQSLFTTDNVVFGTIGCGTITVANGASINLQEDITFTGATGVNLVKFPDNLPDALSFMEGANSYQTFITTDGSEAVAFDQNVGVRTTIPNVGELGSTFTVQGSGTGVGIITSQRDGKTVGWGTGFQVVLDNSAGIPTSYAYYNGFIIDNTADSEGGGLAFYTMKAGTLGERIRVDNLGNFGIGQTTFGTNAEKALAQATGVVPTTSPADCFQMYSADIGGAAGKAGAHFRDEEGNVVSLGTGGILMSAKARVTKCFQFANAALGKGGTKPDEIIVGNYWGWSYDINDDSVFTHKLPDDWASGTDVLIYIRWTINEDYVTNSGEVRWQATWVAHPADTSEAIDDAGTTDNSGDINIPANAYTLTQTLVETIPAASLAAGDELGITIKRVALGDGSDPTADPVITCVGLVYTIDKLGTPT